MAEKRLEANVMTFPESTLRHHHSHHQLVVGLSGDALIEVDGMSVPIDSGHACVVPTDAPHSYCGDSRNNVLVINLDALCPATSDARHPDYEVFAPLFEKPRIMNLDFRLQSLIQLCSSEILHRPAQALMGEHFAAGIMYCLSDRLGRTVHRRHRAHHLDMGEIDAYIDRHLHEKIRVRDLAALACLSESHFHDIFQSVTGVSPHQYVIRHRLRHAKNMLRESDLPLSEISLRVGFSSQSAMTNALKRHEQVTPSAFRSAG